MRTHLRDEELSIDEELTSQGSHKQEKLLEKHKRLAKGMLVHVFLQEFGAG